MAGGCHWQTGAGEGGVKGYSRYIKGHALQGKCSGVFSTLPSSRFISNFHKLRCGADGFFNSNLQIYFKSFLIFVKNLPFNSNFEIYILYLGRDCLYEFVILKNVKKIWGNTLYSKKLNKNLLFLFLVMTF